MPSNAQFTYRGAQKAVTTAGQTVTWTGSEIQGTGVVAYVLSINQDAGTATTNSGWFGTGGIESFRLKAGANTILDLSYKQMEAYTQRYSSSNMRAMDAQDQLTLCIPLYFLDGNTAEQRYSCGFPPGLEPTLEVTQDAGTVPDNDGFTIDIGWWVSRQVPQFSPTIARNALGFTASTTNQQFNLTQDGLMRGIIMPTLGVSQAKVRLGGVDVFDATGQTAATQGNMIYGSQVYKQGTLPPTTSWHTCVNFDTLQPLSGGRDFVQLSTDANYSTAEFDDEVAVYTVTRLG